MAKSSVDRFEQRKLTRAKLIEAAQKLFATSGYEHATVDDIAGEAGYSKGAYYFHFSTKEDILLELLRMWTESRNAAFIDEDPQHLTGDDLRSTLAAFFSYAEAPHWPAVLLEFWSQAVRDEEVGKRLSQAYALWRKKLAAAFTAASAAGLRVDSADDAASVVLAAHDGLAVQKAIGAPGGSAMTAEALADSIVAPLETETPARMPRAIAR